MPRRRIIRNQIPKPSEETAVTVEGSAPDENEPEPDEGSITTETSPSEPVTAPPEPLSQLSTTRKRRAEQENSINSKTGEPKEVITETGKTGVIRLTRVSLRYLSPQKLDTAEVISQEEENSKETPAVEVKEIRTEGVEAIRGRRKRGRPRTKFVGKKVENNEDIDTTSSLVDVNAENVQVETLASDSSKKLEEIDSLKDVEESEASIMKGTESPQILKRRNLLKSPNPIKKEPNFESKGGTEMAIDKDVELNKELKVSGTLDMKEKSGKETCVAPKVELGEEVNVAEVKALVNFDEEEKMDCDFQVKRELCISDKEVKDAPGVDNAVKVEVKEEASLRSQENMNDSPAKTASGRRILRRRIDKVSFDVPESSNTGDVAYEVRSHSAEIAKGSPSRTGKGITEVEGRETIQSPESEVSVKIEPLLQKENIECDKKVGAMTKSTVIKLEDKESMEVSIFNSFEEGERDDVMESPPINKVKDSVSVTQDCKEEVKDPLKSTAVESSKIDTIRVVSAEKLGIKRDTVREAVEVQGCDTSEKREGEELTESAGLEKVKDLISTKLEDKEKIPNDANKDAEDVFEISEEINFDDFIEIDSVDNLDETESADNVPDTEKDHCPITGDEELNYEAPSEEIDDDVSSLDANEILIIEDETEYKSLFDGEMKGGKTDEKGRKEDCKKGRKENDHSRRKSPGKGSLSKDKSDLTRSKSPSKADSKIDHAADDVLLILEKSDILKGNTFRRVVILAHSLYKFQLKGMENANVKVMYEDSQSSEKLISIIEKYRNDYGRNTLWILMAGVLTYTNNEKAGNCKDCKDPLKIIQTKPDQTNKNLLDYVLHLGTLTCDTVQDRLGSKELITMAPPLPALLAIKEHYETHQKLHEAAEDHGLIATKFTYESVRKRYNIFCREWTNKACDRNKSWIDVAALKEYKLTGESNLFPMSSKDRYKVRIEEWHKVMEKFINLVLQTPFPGARISRKRAPCHQVDRREESSPVQTETEEKFTKVVVVRDTPFTKHLKSLTKDMNVEYLDENIDLDEEGLAFIHELQKKHPSRTLYVVLSGVSEIAEPVESGPPKCSLMNCKDQIPVFVTKNDKAGDPEFKDMNIDKMVDIKVKEAFSFATLAIEKLKGGSALFLAPIMPLCAIWSGHATPHSHDGIHRMYKRDPTVPHFIGGASSWIKSAKVLEMKWLDKITSSLKKDSHPYKFLKNYREEKPPVLQYVEDVTVSQVKQVNKAWSKLMADMFQYYLEVSEIKPLVKPVPVKTPVTVHDIEMDLVPPGVNPSEAVVPLDYQVPVNQVTDTLASNAYAHDTAPVRYAYPEADFSMNPPFSSMGVQAHPMMVATAFQGPYAYPGPPQQGFPYQGAAYQDPYFSGWQTPMNPAIAAASTYVPSVPVAPVSNTSAAYAYAPSISVAPVSDTSGVSAGACTIQAPPKLKTAMKGHIVIQNVETDMNEAQAKLLLQEFGEMGEMKWPLNQKDQRAQFLMIHYNQRKHAEKAERILNYLKVFGDNAKVKLVGGDKKEGETKLESEDLEMLLSVHDILDKIKKENRMNKEQRTPLRRQIVKKKAKPVVAGTVGPFQAPATVGALPIPSTVGPPPLPAPVDLPPLPPTEVPLPLPPTVGPLQAPATVGPYRIPETPVFTIIVSNFTSIVPVKDVREMFVELGACDQGVLIKNALHFTFKGEPAMMYALAQFRFPDRKMEVVVKSAADDLRPTYKAIQVAKTMIEKPLSNLLNKIGKVLKEEIDEEMNVYTFKTRLCRYADVCKTKDLCPKFHDAADRRRCPILFRYSDEMCTDWENSGSCEAKDKCASAHSPVEILFHFKNFRSSICPGWQKDRACDKVGRVCSYLHPGKPEMLYNEKWNHMYVEGLKRTLDFLSEAVRNLFLLKDLQCLRVLVVTVSPEMAKLYVDCITDLAKSCNQKVSLLVGDDIKEGTSVAITTLDALRPLVKVDKPQQPKKLDASRLKSLILDDGLALLKNSPKYMLSFFEEVLRKDANLVITADKIENIHFEYAQSKLHPKGGFKKIYAGSLRNKDSRNPSSAKPGSYRKDVLERFHSSTRSADTNSKQKKTSERRRSKDREEKASRNKGSSKERTSASDNSRPSTSRSSSSSKELSSSDNRIKTLATLEIMYKKTLAELEKEFEQQLDLYINSPEFHPEYEQKYTIFIDQYKSHYHRWTNTEHFDKLWGEFWKELITSHLQEEYAFKMQTLQKDFKDKKEKAIKSTTIRDENKHGDDKQERRSSESQKRKSSEDRDSRREKYRRDERSSDVGRERIHHSRDEDRGKTHQLNINEDSDEERRLQYHRNKNSDEEIRFQYNRKEELSRDTYGRGQEYRGYEENPSSYGGLQHNSNTEAYSRDRREESNFPMNSIEEDYDVREAVSLLEELCPSLGVFGPAAQLLMRQISLYGSDRQVLFKLVQDEDNKMILKRLSEKALGVSQMYGSGAQAMKLRLASTHALKLLNMTSAPSQNQRYYGLDIDNIATLTYNIDPSYIVQCIRNALNTKGIINASEMDITEIYEAVRAAHFGIAYAKLHQNQS